MYASAIVGVKVHANFWEVLKIAKCYPSRA